jgi:hypothetical protein
MNAPPPALFEDGGVRTTFVQLPPAAGHGFVGKYELPPNRH